MALLKSLRRKAKGSSAFPTNDDETMAEVRKVQAYNSAMRGGKKAGLTPMAAEGKENSGERFQNSIMRKRRKGHA